jgi:hypothetical protein
MYPFVSIILLLSPLMAYSQEFKLNCQARYNAQKVMETVLTLNENERHKTIGEFNDLIFIISAKENDHIELQSYSFQEPSRSYATGKLSEKSSFIELALWKKDSLLEVRCTKI